MFYEQVAIFRLCTGYNRLKYNLFNKLQLGDTEYNNGIGKMTAKTCWKNAQHIQKEKLILPVPSPFKEKTNSEDVSNLQVNAAIFKYIK